MAWTRSCPYCARRLRAVVPAECIKYRSPIEQVRRGGYGSQFNELPVDGHDGGERKHSEGQALSGLSCHVTDALLSTWI